ncbi:sigma 54-interacting transcriptional regulator [Candidatus Woesearchaeota archaeon]|nr:sigma 54-interacting transcriptional regulator [Candidatus Woesearchaeota archaeon]
MSSIQLTSSHRPFNLRKYGSAKVLDPVYSEIERVATTNATVLLRGESGTGKELFAKAIHTLSHRSENRFTGINCAGIPRELLESELFGYKRGAFTGANRDKPGQMVYANKGTFFLDEIGEMDVYLQAKLLRVLEEREVIVLGFNEHVPIDIRLIASTNRNLEEMIRAGLFREDLFYRLNVMPITIPPLRDRKADIPELVRDFITAFYRQYKLAIHLDEEATIPLMGYHWPGNVRQLRNVIERAVITYGQNGNAQDSDKPLLVHDMTREEVEVLLKKEPNGHAPPIQPSLEMIGNTPQGNRVMALLSVIANRLGNVDAPTVNGGAPPPIRYELEEMYDRMVTGRESFWKVVWDPYMARNLTKSDVRQLIDKGLEYTKGNYTLLTSYFGMERREYKRFVNFLRKHELTLPFREYRILDTPASLKALTE